MADTASKGHKQPPWHQAQDQESGSFGAWLKRQREARGIELREIADHTKISIRYLEALEVDRFDVLPAPVFTKGFLRQYGRYIGLDPDQVVNTYLNALHEEEADQEVSAGASGGTTQRWLVSVLAVVVVGLLALAGYRAFNARQSDAAEAEERPGIAAPPVARAEVPSEPVVAEETIDAPLIVTLYFVDDSWVETIVDGQRQLSEQVAKGESRRVFAQDRVLLSLGNSAGVLVDVNGEAYDLPAADAGIANEIEITLADLVGAD
jgi:cytoskeletal protein RodZ